MVCEVKVSEGSDRAAAQTLDDEDVGGLAGPMGEVGEVTTPCPFLGAWRCSWRAFASAFSWVRTKYAKFCRTSVLVDAPPNHAVPHSCEDLAIFCVHGL